MTKNKYQAINPQTFQRVQQDIEKRYPPKLQERELRSALHQMWGAYFTSRPDFKKLTNKITDAIESSQDIKGVLKQILLIHQSTKERLPILNEFYEDIFSVTGDPSSIIDHACGFNPLTLPWMHLSIKTTYTAYDIDTEEIAFLNAALALLEYDNAQCKVGDIFDYTGDYADVIFMFKLLPLLEHQQKNSTKQILQKQNCKFLVVSFPTFSLSGSNKGMQKFYPAQFESLLRELSWDNYTKKEYPTELVYIIKRHH